MQRLALFGCNPNETAFLIGTFLAILFFHIAFVRRNGPRRRNHTVVLLFLLFALLLSAAIDTYSRGAQVALTVTLLYSAVANRRQLNKACFVAVAAFSVLLFMAYPGAVKRAATIGEIEQDASIGNRLVVWRGALQIMADHPTTGVGLRDLPEIYARWYQPPERSEIYLTMISAPLTVAAAWGGGALLLWLVHALLVQILPRTSAATRNNEWLTALSLASLFQHIAGLFSTMFNVATLLLFFGVHLAFWLVLFRQWTRMRRMPVLRVAGSIAVVVFSAGTAVVSATLYAQRALASVKLIDVQEAGAHTYILSPSRNLDRGVALVYLPAGQLSEYRLRYVLRPLVDAGISVVGCTDRLGSSDWTDEWGAFVKGKTIYFAWEATPDTITSPAERAFREQQSNIRHFIGILSQTSDSASILERLNAQLGAKFTPVFAPSDGTDILAVMRQ